MLIIYISIAKGKGVDKSVMVKTENIEVYLEDLLQSRRFVYIYICSILHSQSGFSIRVEPDPNEDPSQAVMQESRQDPTIADTYADLPYIRYVMIGLDYRSTE